MGLNIVLFNGSVLPSLNLSDHFYSTYWHEIITLFFFSFSKKTSKKAALCIIKDSGPLESSERMSCICPETCASELAAVHSSAES